MSPERKHTSGSNVSSQPGHMLHNRRKQNRLNGTCPDYGRCSLHIPCSDLCWRLEGDLIEAARQERMAAA